MTGYQLQKTTRIWQGLSAPMTSRGSFCWPHHTLTQNRYPSLRLPERALQRYAMSAFTFIFIEFQGVDWLAD